MFYYLVVYDKKYPVKTLLKKRGQIKNIQPKLKFGTCGITFYRSIRFEYIYLFYLRKFFKKLFKKNKKFYKTAKAWVFIRPNHVMTKKSKNARMGKGKGAFVRWCTLMEKGFVFAEFKDISILKLKKSVNKLQNKIKIPIKIVNTPLSYKYNKQLFLKLRYNKNNQV